MYTDKTNYVLEKLGFKETEESGVYLNDNGNSKVVIKADGIYAYSVARGYVDDYSDDYLEMFLNFVPGDRSGDMDLLTKLLRKIFHL
jgi:hypothetical protein